MANSRIIILPDVATAMEMLNLYAPEHLILACRNAEAVAAQVRNAGSVFLGNYAPESAGDYASGTNHTLPTNGYANAYSGVSTDSFVRKISFQELSREGLQSIGKTVIAMAEAEGLGAHAEAVRIRFTENNSWPEYILMMNDINSLLRDNIKKLVPYASARDEFSGTANIFLDANENSLGSPLGDYNRYPDPHQKKIKEKLTEIKGLLPANIFLGNGSDECIDLLYRAFCNPGKDNVIILPPTYGMYEVSGHINDIEVRRAPLTENFGIDLAAIEEQVDAHTKIIWICSPNNPTGNAIDRQDVEMILNNFDGLVVIDEAYINFSRQQGFVRELTEYPNLIVLQTLSKAWGLAGLRMGMAFAGEPVIDVLNKIKPPYNIGQATQELVLRALQETSVVNGMIREIVRMRNELAEKLGQLPTVVKVYPSEANFLLVQIDNARNVYEILLSKGIVVRDRSSAPGCSDCLRITVGTKEQNDMLIETLSEWGNG